jgi:hypothetical protein
MPCRIFLKASAGKPLLSTNLSPYPLPFPREGGTLRKEAKPPFLFLPPLYEISDRKKESQKIV